MCSFRILLIRVTSPALLISNIFTNFQIDLISVLTALLMKNGIYLKQIKSILQLYMSLNLLK